MKNIHLAILAMTPGIGNVKLRSLIEAYGSAEAVWQADRNQLIASGRLSETLCNNLVHTRENKDIDKLASRWEKTGVQIVSLWDDNYPQLLANTYNPPSLLYYRGALPSHDKIVAVVGSRKATPYGRNVCQMLAAELAEAGVVIVSGAARGIDSCAHNGALERGITVAVLANGVDISYPPENAKLLARIAESGAVISEYPPGTPPQAGQFPARNRIINGLARGVLVIEAAERSGALITADFALEEGRDVFAVPGSVLSQASKGTHRLIKQGAKLVDCAQDIFDEYGWSDVHKQTGKIDVSHDEEVVLSLIPFDRPMTLDEIIGKTNFSVSTVTYIALQLELQGLVTQSGGQRYLRTAKGGF